MHHVALLEPLDFIKNQKYRAETIGQLLASLMKSGALCKFAVTPHHRFLQSSWAITTQETCSNREITCATCSLEHMKLK